MSWIKVTEDVMYKKAAKRALGVLDILTEIGKEEIWRYNEHAEIDHIVSNRERSR